MKFNLGTISKASCYCEHDGFVYVSESLIEVSTPYPMSSICVNTSKGKPLVFQLEMFDFDLPKYLLHFFSSAFGLAYIFCCFTIHPYNCFLG